MTPLENYYEKLFAAQEAEKCLNESESYSRLENPVGTCNTLWIPIYTSNRTAVINLNHTLTGFDSEGNLWGENGNCSTPYRVIQIPDSWNENDISKLADIVAKKLNKPEGYDNIRVLKADTRMNIILETINEIILNV